MLEICTYRNAKTPIKTIVFDGNNILTENVLKSAVNLNELKRSIYFGLNSTGEEKLYPSILSTTIIVMLIVSDRFERSYRFTVRSLPLVVFIIYRLFYNLPNSIPLDYRAYSIGYSLHTQYIYGKGLSCQSPVGRKLVGCYKYVTRIFNLNRFNIELKIVSKIIATDLLKLNLIMSASLTTFDLKLSRI